LGVNKPKKMQNFEQLLKGFDDSFYMPHGKYTKINEKQVKSNKNLVILSSSNIAGASIIKSADNKQIFITGHMEYDRETLKGEYERDLAKGLGTKKPKNYFTDSSCTQVEHKWASSANLLYSNWLNYYVYQVTPFKW